MRLGTNIGPQPGRINQNFAIFLFKFQIKSLKQFLAVFLAQKFLGGFGTYFELVFAFYKRIKRKTNHVFQSKKFFLKV